MLDVRVDGKSVVTDQIAYIDLTGKLDVIASPNKLYGTDSDGREHMYDLKEVMGVQHVYLNGKELPVTDNSVHIDGVAMDADVVHKVTTPNVIYATDGNGDQTTISVSHFATADALNGVANRVTAIEGTLPNKQDKDPDAVNGNLAVFQNGQTVDGGTSLASINSTLTNHGDRITALEGDVDEIRQDINEVNQTIGGIQSDIGSINSTIENSLAKDWKATSGGHAILNHPVEPDLRSITITNLALGDEETYRAYSSEVILSINPVSGAAGAVLIGSNNSAAANGVSIGPSSSAGSSAVAMGQMSSASGGSSVAIGESASSSATDSVAIGHGAVATGDRSVAIGSGSLADDDDVVSVGFDDASGRSPVYRRVTAVKDPENDHDAVTKKYADDKLNDLETTVSNSYNDLNNKIKTAIEAILNKVYGGGTFNSSNGQITWPNNSKIPVGNLNIYSAGGSGNTFNNAIRSRAGDTDGDIKVN